MKDEINLLDYWRVLIRGRKFIVLATFFVTLAAVGLSLVWPKTYRASAVILPISAQRSGGLAAMVSQMGLGAFLGGLADSSSSSAQILALLKSRTLKENVIQKYNLLPALFEKNWDSSKKQWKKRPPNMDDALQKLETIVKFVDDKKNQTISIVVIAREPALAVEFANAFVDELFNHINENTFTVAKRNRIFIEGQLERNKRDLLEAGKELSSFYVTNRVSDAVPTVDVNVGLGHENPRADSEDVEDLQQRINTVAEKIRASRVVKGIPQQVYLQYLTLQQELLGRVNALLTQQYEMAKIEESKEDLTFQVIDRARIPFHRHSPRRAQAVATTFVASIFLSVFIVLFRNYWLGLKADNGCDS